MGKRREALVACGDKRMGTGISIWDIETAELIMHISTCASPSHGLLCLNDQFLVASQVNKHGSVGGGAIFTWPLNKPHSPLRSYPIEAIGPIACTMDGVYLAGGSPSGNAYVWEVANGRLLKTWRAHHTSLKCIIFSNDDSLLISGSDDGMICLWSMISLLDLENFGRSSSLLHYSSEHKLSVSGLLTTSGSSNSTFISSSIDGTCKAWDLVSGRLIQTLEYPLAITAITLHPAEQFLFAGSMDGRIYVTMFNSGLIDDPLVEEPLVVLDGHKGSITSLTFSTTGMVSASEDSTICLWDAITWTAVRRFNYQKGAVTNVVVVPLSSLPPPSNHQRVPRVSALQKCPHPDNSSQGAASLLHPSSFLQDNQISPSFRTISLDQQIYEMEEEYTPAAFQMKVETCIYQRMWATRMTKHVMEMNKHLQSRLQDMMQIRLLGNTEDDVTNAKRKNKKLKIETSRQEEKLL